MYEILNMFHKEFVDMFMIYTQKLTFLAALTYLLSPSNRRIDADFALPPRFTFYINMASTNACFLNIYYYYYYYYSKSWY